MPNLNHCPGKSEKPTIPNGMKDLLQMIVVEIDGHIRLNCQASGK